MTDPSGWIAFVLVLTLAWAVARWRAAALKQAPPSGNPIKTQSIDNTLDVCDRKDLKVGGLESIDDR